MDYNKAFTKMMYTSDNPLDGAVLIFNEIADKRDFTHRSLKRSENGELISQDGNWDPKSVKDIIDELEYWYSLYFEEGSIRHDEEYRDRHLIKKAIDFLEAYSQK